MKKVLFFTLTLIFIISNQSCKKEAPDYKAKAANPEFLHRSLVALTDVIVHDIFSPPVSSRIYAYANISAYEVLYRENPEYQSLAGQLTALEPAPAPDEGKEYCLHLAAVHAFLRTGKALIFSEEKMTEFQDKIYAEFKALGIPDDVYERSMQYGEAVSKHIMAWADKDNYKQTRTAPKYTIQESPETWKPTPPAYSEGLEPHWGEIRPMTLDSSSQFRPGPPPAYSLDKNSQFYKEVMEVRDALSTADSSERIDIAWFWDCNPLTTHQSGHVVYTTKKVSPGGHWLYIAKDFCHQRSLSMLQASEVYTKVALALFDGFISCWEAKYKYVLVRPETVINAFVDDRWAPLIQTPPFPEYTSGHSTISRASATVLTDYFGDKVAFTDSLATNYGMKPRTFNSFYQASDEASISRFYGGIHYMSGLNVGVEQGGKIGNWIVQNVKMRKG